MIIINAVECKDVKVEQSIIDRYLNDNQESTLFTDDKRIKSYIESNYDIRRCVYNPSLVGMWLMVEENSIIFLTKIENTCSQVYYDLNKKYTIVCVETSYELDIANPIDADTKFNAVGITGGVLPG